MTINEQILEKLDGILPLIAEIDFNINTLEKFHNKLSYNELKMFENYDLLSILRHYFWKSSILDLCKLFVEDEKYSFNCLLNILENNFKNVIFKSHLSKEEIKEFRESLKKSSNQIDHIKEVRDINIAHKDNKNPSDPIMLSELSYLITLAKEIFSKIFGTINDSTIIWQLTDDNRALLLIKDIAKYNTIKELVFKTDLSQKREISTRDLLNIIDINYLRQEF